MDLRNTDDDMVIIDGELQFVTGQTAIGQHIGMRLKTWLGETVYDQSAGVPYLQVIFQRIVSLDSVRFILSRVVLDTPGVISLVADLDLDLDSQTRTLTASGTAVTIEGNVDFSTIIEAAE
jgi:hypothetical protein